MPGNRLAFPKIEDELRRCLGEVFRGVSMSGIVSVTLELPESDFPCMPSLKAPFYYWARRDDERCLIGTGEICRLEARGAGRFSQLQQKFDHLQREWRYLGSGHATNSAALFCYSFDPDEEASNGWKGLPNSCILIPELLFEYADGRCHISFTTDDLAMGEEALIDRWSSEYRQLIEAIQQDAVETGHGSFQPVDVYPADKAWMDKVAQAVADIHKSDLDKVVLSRRLRLKGDTPFDAVPLMMQLLERYPGCTLFAVALDEKIVISATPECLVSLDQGVVRCDAMAGTVADGETPDEKMVEFEHLPVVRKIERILRPLCNQLDIIDAPQLLQLHGLQHIWTPLRGEVKDDVTLFELIDRLHPTPAVAGAPDNMARQWLVQNDDYKRGWYCGGFGWLDRRGEGDASVLLRCALLMDDVAELFAGAGITAYSDPQREFQETELKMRAILDLL